MGSILNLKKRVPRIINGIKVGYQGISDCDSQRLAVDTEMVRRSGVLRSRSSNDETAVVPQLFRLAH